ncbi:hypothetical protein D210916BOD24_33720 [Alteromonas sp. D210916BOD_24]|uniref:uroporphyrinogen-III synthase n=1 Tax=Alteromonas sp. D210916BOD_24 TaxID=3157618 RepID=UPI00399D21CD
MLLFTRPRPKLTTSAEAFEKAGINAVGVATSDIVLIPSQFEAVKAFLTGNKVDIVIVTSVYAVDCAVESADALKKIQKPCPEFIAIGDATAQKLSAGLSRITSAEVSTPNVHTSEGILAMHQLNEENGKQIVIIKGEGGRDTIEQGIQLKGGDVRTFCVYKREQLACPISTKRWKIGDVSGIIATSEAMAQQLLSQYGDALVQLPWLTVSERVKSTLIQSGIKRVGVCHRATDQALIAWVKDNWEY